MASNHDICLAFDVYGTLLSTASIAEKLAVLYGNDSAKGAHVAAEWRKYQLEYTWRLNSMGEHCRPTYTLGRPSHKKSN